MIFLVLSELNDDSNNQHGYFTIDRKEDIAYLRFFHFATCCALKATMICYGVMLSFCFHSALSRIFFFFPFCFPDFIGKN